MFRRSTQMTHNQPNNGVVLRDRYAHLSSGQPDDRSSSDAVRHVRQIGESGIAAENAPDKQATIHVAIRGLPAR
jgi:hypothetical protein